MVLGDAVAAAAAHGPAALAAGDLDRDGRVEIITGAGAGGAAHVRVFRGAGLKELAGFLAADPTSRSGVKVLVADATSDGRPDVITTAGSTTGAFDPLDDDFLGGVPVG